MLKVLWGKLQFFKRMSSFLDVFIQELNVGVFVSFYPSVFVLFSFTQGLCTRKEKLLWGLWLGVFELPSLELTKKQESASHSPAIPLKKNQITDLKKKTRSSRFDSPALLWQRRSLQRLRERHPVDASRRL